MPSIRESVLTKTKNIKNVLEVTVDLGEYVQPYLMEALFDTDDPPRLDVNPPTSWTDMFASKNYKYVNVEKRPDRDYTQGFLFQFVGDVGVGTPLQDSYLRSKADMRSKLNKLSKVTKKIDEILSYTPSMRDDIHSFESLELFGPESNEDLSEIEAKHRAFVSKVKERFEDYAEGAQLLADNLGATESEQSKDEIVEGTGLLLSATQALDELKSDLDSLRHDLVQVLDDREDRTNGFFKT